jgi:predicted transcriptional regulator
MARLLEGFGGNLKLAQLRRKYSSETVAQCADITRRTLSKVEKGDAGVTLGIYARMMQVLRQETISLNWLLVMPLDASRRRQGSLEKASHQTDIHEISQGKTY